MALTLGAPPAQQPSIDDLLAALGITGAPGQGGAAPQPQGGQAANPLLNGWGVGPPPDAAPQALPSNAAPPAQPQASLPQLPSSVLYGNRNPVGDILDNVFLGGAIQKVRGTERTRALADYQTQMGQLAAQRMINFANSQTGPDAALAQADPAGYLKIAEDRVGPHEIKSGGTLDLGNGQQRYAPVFGVDDKSGIPQSVSPNGAQVLGPSLGGDVTAKDGMILSSRTGPTGQTYSTPQSIAPGASLAGFTPTTSGSPQGGSQAGPSYSAPQAPPTSSAAPLQARWAQGGASPQDQATLLATARIESGANPNAPNNGSSTGMFQFHPATFAALGGTNINDPGQQADAALRLLKQNQAVLQSKGLPITQANTYFLHQQGAPGGTALLGADPNANAVQVLQSSGIYQNSAQARRAITRNFGTADMTAGQFVGMWQSKFNRRLKQVGTPDQGQATPQPSAPGSVPQGNLPPGVQMLMQGRGYTQNPDGSQTSPAGEQTAGPGMFKPEMIITTRDNARGSDEIKNSQQSQAAFQAMIQLAQQPPGGMRAYALRDTYARTINPSGVVRSGTIDAIKHSQGVPANIQSYLMNLKGDGDVPPQIIQQLLDAAQPFAAAHYAQASALNQANAAMAQRHGYDPRDVVVPIGDAPQRFVLGAHNGTGGNQDPLSAARAAIQKGASRAAVIQRLQQNGINPAGL